MPFDAIRDHPEQYLLDAKDANLFKNPFEISAKELDSLIAYLAKTSRFFKRFDASVADGVAEATSSKSLLSSPVKDGDSSSGASASTGSPSLKGNNKGKKKAAENENSSSSGSTENATTAVTPSSSPPNRQHKPHATPPRTPKASVTHSEGPGEQFTGITQTSSHVSVIQPPSVTSASGSTDNATTTVAPSSPPHRQHESQATAPRTPKASVTHSEGPDEEFSGITQTSSLLTPVRASSLVSAIQSPSVKSVKKALKKRKGNIISEGPSKK